MPIQTKIFIFLLSLFLLSGLGAALAQTEVSEAISLDEDVQPIDLGIGEPNILPDSPFYFLKEWGRNIQSFFTFDLVKKAELKLKFANEKIIEAEKLTERNKNSEIIKKGLENYQNEINKIKAVTENIKGKAAESPEVDKFLDKFTKHQILHYRILQKLENQVPSEVSEKIKEARETHLERFGEVMTELEENKEKLKERLEKNLEEIKGSQFKNFKNLEVLLELEEKVPEETKETIQQVQENALKNLKDDLEQMSSGDQEKFKEYLEKVSGVKETQLEILENLKLELKEMPEIQQKIIESKDKVLEKIQLKAVPKEIEKPQACIEIWKPVCGKDGKTYSNECFAKTAGTEIDYEGACKEEKSITVLSPNGGEVWKEGETYNITWKSTGIDKVNLYCDDFLPDWMSVSPSSPPTPIVTNLIASSGKYSWTIPLGTVPYISNDLYIEIKEVDSILSDRSDNPFTIIPEEKMEPPEEKPPEDKEEIMPEDKATDWRTYRNEWYGFELTFPERWKEYEVKEEKEGVGFGLQHSKEEDYRPVFFITVFTKEEWEECQSEENSHCGTYIAEKGNNVFSYGLWESYGDEGYIGFPEVIADEIYQGPFFDVQTKIIPTFKLIDLGACEYRKGDYEMRVYDSQDRVTGLVNGEIKEEVPNAVYDSENDEVVVFDPRDSYTYELFCIKEGNYQFGNHSIEGGEVTTFNAINIPIFPGETHRYEFDWGALLRGENGVILLIDADNDGLFEKKINSDIKLTCQEFIAIMEAN